MAVAMVAASSPVFSPSRSSLSCRTSSSSSPETLRSDSLPSSPSLSRFQKQPSGLRAFSPESLNASVTVAKAAAAATMGGLKRKKPSMIDIPAQPVTFDLPVREEGERREVVEVETERFAVCCKKGRRREAVEDRHSVVVDVDGDPKQAFFGVFDGHRGALAAEFAAQNLSKNIKCELMNDGGDNVEEAIKNGYLTTDAEFLKEGTLGGTCCVTALILNEHLIVSNVGDCRAVVSRGGMAEALTSDHRPSRDDEKERIESLGGYVDFCHGTWRIQGSLGVSRAIGDSHLKQWVIAEPETTILRIKPETEFLILASDGLWEKVSNQEVVDVVKPFCMKSSGTSSLLSACRKLTDLSRSRGSVDDITVMVIQLEHFI
ncbi:putative protein phosphatase 2C 2 [Acorus calamus]|uniref:protein-serine/threonine phosphatase n=1 Tax=Acorus calamus TaxID=4465 RepID=A0AAV9C560_ACOCL|nr:putative protein phosphatase 2C 2 [Acorus calamus]